MILTERDVSIIVQSAGHDAAELLRGGGLAAVADYHALQASMVEQTIALISETQDVVSMATQAALVQAVFPGSQTYETAAMPPMPGGPADQLQVPPAALPPQYAPAPIPQQPPYPQAPQPAMFPSQQQTYQQAPQPQMAYAGGPGYPPPAPPQQTGYGPPRCSKCNGEMYDNVDNNQRRRQAGFSLQPDYKCRNQQCEGKVWPPDFTNFKHLPKPPQGWR